MKPEFVSPLGELLPEIEMVIATSPVGGGCISEAMRVVVRNATGDEPTLFVKSNHREMLDNFQCEAAGLRELAAAETVRVPQPIAVGEGGGRALLVTTWIESGRRDAEFFSRFGRQLAALHQATRGTRIGWQRDNYLGTARQPNEARTSWAEFVADQRIGYQLRWAIDQGLADGRLARDGQRIIDRMPELLQGRDEETSLLHGDLWSGNYLCDSSGAVVIVDPAVYYGCREAEFGMLRLFGGCPAEFDQAYQDQWPMPGGWQRRASVYVLYHLLNHLNLFGRGYAGQCRQVAAEILG